MNFSLLLTLYLCTAFAVWHTEPRDSGNPCMSIREFVLGSLLSPFLLPYILLDRYERLPEREKEPAIHVTIAIAVIFILSATLFTA